MDVFFKDRPEIDLDVVKKDRTYARKARYTLQTDTSDEESLPVASFCTVCGSDDCWLDASQCHAQNKAELQEYL